MGCWRFGATADRLGRWLPTCVWAIFLQVRHHTDLRTYWHSYPCPQSPASIDTASTLIVTWLFSV